jgi:hypothetical protein
MAQDLERATALIVDLHRFFADWISGACPKDRSVLGERAISHLSTGFFGILPTGRTFTPADMETWLWAVHGASPGFRIAVHRVTIRQRIGSALVVTYEEWAHDAPEPPHRNARLSTMVLQDEGHRLAIVHLQETWLPDEVVAGGDFRF